MSTKIYFPSLGEDGWVTGSLKTIDLMFSHFFLAERSQSYEWQGHVKSLPWIIQDCQGDMAKLVRSIETTLIEYFSWAFDNVVVEALEVPTDTSAASFSIYVKMTDTTGKEFVLGKLLESLDGKITKIVSLNNGTS